MKKRTVRISRTARQAPDAQRQDRATLIAFYALMSALAAALVYLVIMLFAM